MTAENFMVIAHRGASSYAPENTLAAFDLALQMGARHIELDVHLSADGHIVVIHDDTLDRTTSGSGRIAAQTLAKLRQLDAGSWFRPEFAGERIPTFVEVLERYAGRAHLHVEIKGSTPSLSERTVEAIRRRGMSGMVTITSFQKARLEEIRACAPELPTGWLVREEIDVVIPQSRAMGLVQLCPRAPTVTPEMVRRLHAEGFVVRAWGVASELLMEQVVQAGADGMTVNFPDKLIAYLRSPTAAHRHS
jgi:glycerophosphoryl diester phosphodiesterase